MTNTVVTNRHHLHKFADKLGNAAETPKPLPIKHHSTADRAAASGIVSVTHFTPSYVTNRIKSLILLCYLKSFLRVQRL